MDSLLASRLQIALLFLLHFSTCNLSSQGFKQVSFSILSIMIMPYSINLTLTLLNSLHVINFINMNIKIRT